MPKKPFHGKKHFHCLNLESLEERVTPIVGAYYSDASTTNNPDFNGVVQIALSNNTVGSGALMFNRNYILTAAHVVTDNLGNKVSGLVKFFENSSNAVSLSIPFGATDVSIVNGYNPGAIGLSPNDVAVINIHNQAPIGVPGYELYRSFDEIGKSFTMVGFGNTGNGTSAALPGTTGTKRIGVNTFEALGSDVSEPGFYRDLVYDFDNGTNSGNSLFTNYGVNSTLGETSSGILIEADAASGDSGGPGFITVNGALEIAGIVSGGTLNSAFKGIEYYSRVSAFANEIDSLTGKQTLAVTASPLFTASPGSSPASYSSPVVKIYDSSSAIPSRPVASVMAFTPSFTGGVVTALGDVNHDGVIDLIAGAGKGGGPNIKVISGTDFSTVLYNFFAFEPGFTGGVTLSSIDLDGDLYSDIVVGAGPGGGPRIKVFSGRNLTVLRDFFAFEPTFSGGVNIATGLINGDATPDIVVGAGAGGGPRLKVFDGSNMAVILDFFVYDPVFRGGVHVAAGNIDGLANQEIVVGAGNGGGPNVRVYDSTGNLLQDFFAYNPLFTGGVRVATGLTSSTATSADIITGPGIGATPNVRSYNSQGQLAQLNFFAFSQAFSGGIFVGGRGF